MRERPIVSVMLIAVAVGAVAEASAEFANFAVPTHRMGSPLVVKEQSGLRFPAIRVLGFDLTNKSQKQAGQAERSPPPFYGNKLSPYISL